jgi:hypothetical protein
MVDDKMTVGDDEVVVVVVVVVVAEDDDNNCGAVMHRPTDW